MKCYIFDIDDTLIIHDNNISLNYDNIKIDHELIELIKNINHPKFVLTNAIYEHGNIVLNKLNIVNDIQKIYSRDTIPFMKPYPKCYKEVMKNIIKELNYTLPKEYIFFDDLLENLYGAKQKKWITIWIHPKYNEYTTYKFVDHAYPTIKDALKNIDII